MAGIVIGMLRNLLWKRVWRRWRPPADSLGPREEVQVPGKRLSMRKTREVLRLHFDLKLGQRQIARSANISQSTVHDYLGAVHDGGLELAAAGGDVRGTVGSSSVSCRSGQGPRTGFRASAVRLRPHSRRAATKSWCAFGVKPPQKRFSKCKRMPGIRRRYSVATKSL